MQRFGEPAHALLKRRQPDQDQREAGDCRARRRQPPASDHLEQRADEDDRQRCGGERDPDPERRHQPAGAGGADVGAEHEAQALREGEEPGADQPDGGHGGGARRLHQERDDRAPERAEQRRRRRLFHHLLQGCAGERLEPVGHDRHAEQEQAHSADDGNDRLQVSSRPLCDSTVGMAIGSAGGCACRPDGQPALLDSLPGSTRQAGDVADRHVERELERPARARRLRQQEAALQRGDHRGRELGRVRLGLELAAVAHRA